MEEQPTNETTPEQGQVEESGQPLAEQPQADVSSNSGAEESAELSTDKTEEAAPEWDAKTSYEALQKNYDQVNQSYAELRKEFTRRTQNESELQRKLDALTETINKATETPIDPKQFFNDLQTQGPKAFQPLIQKEVNAVKQRLEQELQAKDEAITQMQFETGKLARRADPKNYPDFQELEPVMAQLVADEKISLDMSQGAGSVLDTLYKLARNMNADKAIQKAKESGRKEADAQAAKDASTRVAGRGKTGPVADPTKLSLEELRKRMVAELGEADQNGQ